MDDPSPQAGTSADDLRALEALDLPHLRNFAKDLIHENRRLRLIQKTLAKAGVGTGAVVELYSNERFGEHYFGFVICRADRDEVAFCGDVREAIDRHLGPVLVAMNQKLLGTSAVDRKRAPETPEDRAALATAIYEALVENGEIEHSLKACVTEDFCVLYGYGAHLDALVSNVVEVASTYTAFAVRRSYLAEQLQRVGRTGDAELVRRVVPSEGDRGLRSAAARLLVCELGGELEVQWHGGLADSTRAATVRGEDHGAQVRAALDAFHATPSFVRASYWKRADEASCVGDASCVVFGVGAHLQVLWPGAFARPGEYECFAWLEREVASCLELADRPEAAKLVRTGPSTPRPEGARKLVIVTEGAVAVFWWNGTEVVGQ